MYFKHIVNRNWVPFRLWIFVSVLLLGIVLQPDAQARQACHWKDAGWLMSCRSDWQAIATGCVGLKNKSGQVIRVKVTGNDKFNVKKKFTIGKHQKADFKQMSVHACEKKVDGKWKKVRCENVFDRTKNQGSGGGCGCNTFECLPGW